MAAIIKSVHIENFRSIRSVDAALTPLSVFVGRNDCGKSNILRALNLFFNGETNPGVDFAFSEDFNFFASVRARRAPEVLVRVEIGLPESYHATNGQVIIWTKRWRDDGLWSEEYDYFGQRITRNRRGQEVREDVDIPDKSNVHALLRKIEFEYVPAIKDAEYFDGLRGRIYGIIAEVAARTFHDSSTAFEQSIGDHLDELTANIKASLGFDTRLALPRDLSHIFERLEFQSGEKRVSLNNRGDGIKARHIPLILRFMADKKAELQRRGGAPISSIWAYEEPENNLEIGSAVQLADEMLDFARRGTAQIILTTHSPAFYDLGQREEEVAMNFVVRASDTEGTQIRTDSAGIDESLGTLAMLAPRISDMVSAVREQETARAEAARLAEELCPRIFVEGETDRLILSRALQVFFPAAAEQVRFETKRDGGGHSYVIDMLTGWRAQHKHHTDRPKAVGIVDSDATAQKTAFNETPRNTESAKCLVYPLPAALRAPRAAGFQVYASLETLYPIAIWQDAERRSHLEPRSPMKVYPSNLADRILRGQAQPDEGLDPAWSIFVTHDVGLDHKMPMAQRLRRQNDVDARTTLQNFEPVLREALSYLGVLPAARP